MAQDDLFKRYLEIGASVLGMTRERAEGIVRDLVASGEVARNQAGKAADWLVERGRAGTEELSDMIRREIRQQITALGLATKDDLAALQAQVDELRAAAVGAGAAATGAPKAATARGVKKAAKVAKASTTARVTKPAGISRGGSVRKRPPPAGTGSPGS